MSPILESYGLSNLSRDQMLALRDALHDAVEVPQALLDIPESFREELSRREAEIDANPDDCIPWEKVRETIRANYGI